MTFRTVLLSKDHKRDSFTCEQPGLTKYLKEHASQDIRKRLSLCFVSLDSQNNITGFYTLSNASISKELIPEKIRVKLGYKDLPVTLLGRLARDITQKGKGIGEMLLIDALKRSFDASSDSTASYAIVTDPIDDMAEQFYQRFGFQKLEGSSRMFLMMKTLEELFREQP